jgi:hypothetical protein
MSWTELVILRSNRPACLRTARGDHRLQPGDVLLTRAADDDGLLFRPVVMLFANDLWVYMDARRCADEGTPVVLRMGAVVIERPAAWFVGCLVLWIIFVQCYVPCGAGTTALRTSHDTAGQISAAAYQPH